MQIEKSFQKKFIPATTHSKKRRNLLHSNKLKRTNSQIIYNHDNFMDETNSLRSKSLKRTSSDDILYDEQNDYDNESSKNNLKNPSSSKEENESEQESNLMSKKIDELIKIKNLCEKTLNDLQNHKKNNLPYSYKHKFNKSFSDKNRNKNDKISNSYKSKESNSYVSENLSNFNDIENINNNINNNNKKNLSINIDNFKNKNNKEKKINKVNDPTLSRYFKLIKEGNNSTNDFTKLKKKYLDLKNMHDFTLSKLEKEKNKNNKQKEEIELLKNSIKLNSINYLNNNNIFNNDEKSKMIKNLKDQNETYRKELVLSQAMINSLRSEIEDNNKTHIKKKFKPMKIKGIEPNNINNNQNINKDIIDNNRYLFNYPHINNDINDENNNIYNNQNIDEPNINNFEYNKLINKIEELNYALNKKNEILNSILIENNKLRNELKLNKNNSYQRNSSKKLNRSISMPDISMNEFRDKIKYMFDLLYQDSLSLISKYEQYKNNTISDYNNLILSEQFFNELQKLKDKLYINKDFEKFNINSNHIRNYMELAKLITNEFDKLLLYVNDLNQQKIFNKFENDNKNLHINKIYDKINLIFDKERNNLVDLCLLSTQYISGKPRELILEGLNLIKSLGNLYEEKSMLNEDQKENIDRNKVLINRQEEQLEKVKKELNINDNNKYEDYYFNYNANNNDINGNNNNNSGLTYATKYYS